MKVGIYFDLRNPARWRQPDSRLYGFTLEMCEEAERLGADSIWNTEHHMFDDGYLTQPLVFHAAVAARTKRVRLGTGILLAPLRSAALIAEEAALVDIISNGRLDLGLGAGYRVPEFELFGADITKRYTTTDSRARELRRIWSEGKLTPMPVQQRLPIWMGYQGPQGARRAGLMGEYLLTCEAAMWEPYRQGLIEGGHDPAKAKMSGGLSMWVTEDPERDWPVVAEHFAYQLDSYRKYMVEGTDQPLPRPVDANRIRQREMRGPLGWFICDTPENCAQKIKAYTAGAPVESIYLWGSIGGMPEDMQARHIHTVLTKLKPLLA